MQKEIITYMKEKLEIYKHMVKITQEFIDTIESIETPKSKSTNEQVVRVIIENKI